MLKKETIDLLNSNEKNFKNIFSICIGKAFLHQSRFIDYIGKYNRWDTNIKEGILKLDDKVFNVEYIGTTSTTDNFWNSSELEEVIPKQYSNLMMNTRQIMGLLNLAGVTEEKFLLNGDINGYNLSMIYVAFAPEKVAYFCGSGGNAQIYMFVKNLPDNIFKKMNSVEFSTCISKIISTFNVEHKLMVKALLTENEIMYECNQNNIIAKFDDNSILTVEFNENDLIRNITGNLSLENNESSRTEVVQETMNSNVQNTVEFNENDLVRNITGNLSLENNESSRTGYVQETMNSNVQNNVTSNIQNKQIRNNKQKDEPYSMAVVGFICSLVGLIIMGMPMGFAALYLAISAKKGMANSSNKKGNGLATAAIIIGVIDVIFTMLGIIMK